MDDNLQEASSAPTETQTPNPAENVSTPETQTAPDANHSQPTDTTSAVDETQVVEKPKSLLDAVKAASKLDEADRVSTDPEQKDAASDAESAAAKAKTDEAKAEAAKAEDENVPFHKHPRWQELLKERDSYKGDAVQFRQITGFMAQNQLSSEEVAKGFEIMSALKNDPLRARELLAPYAKALDEYVGAVLPQDLSKKVDDGIMDEASAQELARARNEAALQRARLEQTAAMQNQAYAYQSQAAIQQTVGSWEEGIKQRDADYAAKQALVLDRTRAYLASGQPQTPEQALAIVERAYSDVNETLKGFAPRRQPVRSVSSAVSSTTSQPVARTLQEAIRIAATKS
jgi:hypothetical protein